MASGGYHPPASPAPVSGPGALSQRTDAPPLAVSGLAYGSNGPLNQQMSGLPNGQAPNVPPMNPPGGPQSPSGAQILPPSAPTTLPNQPISHGAPFGPGPNSVPGQQPYTLTDILGRMLGNDIAGRLEDVYLNAEKNGL